MCGVEHCRCRRGVGVRCRGGTWPCIRRRGPPRPAGRGCYAGGLVGGIGIGIGIGIGTAGPPGRGQAALRGRTARQRYGNALPCERECAACCSWA